MSNIANLLKMAKWRDKYFRNNLTLSCIIQAPLRKSDSHGHPVYTFLPTIDDIKVKIYFLMLLQYKQF